MEGLPGGQLALILRLLGDVERRRVQELNVAAHLVLHHLLEGLLLPLDLLAHSLHRRDPSPGNLVCRLLAPAYVLAHSLTSRLNISVSDHIFPMWGPRNYAQ